MTETHHHLRHINYDDKIFLQVLSYRW